MDDRVAKVITHCPVCHSGYVATHIHQVAGRGQVCLFHCTCLKCGQSMLAVVLEQAGFLSSVGMLTDQSIQDAYRFHEAAPISEEDCLQAHRWLFEHGQAFCRALQSPPATSA